MIFFVLMYFSATKSRNRLKGGINVFDSTGKELVSIFITLIIPKIKTIVGAKLSTFRLDQFKVLM